ncbi:MAG: hypothetical protein HY743_05745 [Deltaproteobacteria bacterium]|nr:hypothetical protein [Deltaproteobacteria bacterium]
MDQRLLELQQAKVIEIVHQSARAGVQKILELALSAFYFADHVIQVVESANTLPRPIACQEGCYFCCCNQVELTTPEALFLGHYGEQHFADEEKKGLMSALRRSLDLQAGKHKVEMARIRPPCPLLQDRKCSAYPARPLVFSQGLLAGCQAVGCQSAPLELSRALLDYFNQPRPVERWLQGEKVFKISRPPKN